MKTTTPNNNTRKSPRLASKQLSSQDISPETRNAIEEANEEFYDNLNKEALSQDDMGTPSKKLAFSDSDEDDLSEDEDEEDDEAEAQDEDNEEKDTEDDAAYTTAEDTTAPVEPYEDLDSIKPFTLSQLDDDQRELQNGNNYADTTQEDEDVQEEEAEDDIEEYDDDEILPVPTINIPVKAAAIGLRSPATGTSSLGSHGRVGTSNPHVETDDTEFNNAALQKAKYTYQTHKRLTDKHKTTLAMFQPPLAADNPFVKEWGGMKKQEKVLHEQYLSMLRVIRRSMEKRSDQTLLEQQARARENRKSIGQDADSTGTPGTRANPEVNTPATTVSVSTGRSGDKGGKVMVTPRLKIHRKDPNSNRHLPYAATQPFVINTPALQKILGRVTAPIDYENEVALEVYVPKLNEEILEQLNSIIRNNISLAANELFTADVTTHGAQQIVLLFEQPAFIPASIRLKPSLQRNAIFAVAGNNEKYRQLSIDFDQCNTDYQKVAKPIMTRDKKLVHLMAQQRSRDVLLQHIYRLCQVCTASKIPPQVSTELLTLNHPLTQGAPEPTNSAEEQKLITGYAYLLIIVINTTILAEYAGVSNNALLTQAANYLLAPRFIEVGKFINFGIHVKIGHLNFPAPSDKVWDQAREVATEMADIIIHISMEQRVAYAQDYVRSLSIIAVRKCGIRQEHINATSSIATILKNAATGTDVQTINIINHWRRVLSQRTMSRCKKEFQRHSGKNTKALPDTSPQKSNNTAVQGSRGNPLLPGSPKGRTRTPAELRDKKRKRHEKTLRLKKIKTAEETRTRLDKESTKLDAERAALAKQTAANIEARRVINDILQPQQQQQQSQLPPPPNSPQQPPFQQQQQRTQRQQQQQRRDKNKDRTKDTRRRHPK